MSDESSVPDAEYIARTKAGDLQAFGELYRKYVTQIYRYIRTRVSTERDAEDLTENVFLKAFEALETYQERGAPFGAFLYMVARHAVVDHYRSQKPLEQADDLSIVGNEVSSAEGALINKQELLEISNALAKLPENYREVIRLRVLMEMPTAEVAEWLGKQPSTVRVLLHRALKALRKSLGVVDER
jgi:RNA polymerase sigma-70 factor (ECF subfamily)